MKRAFEQYIEELKSDIASRVYTEGQGASFEDKFTDYCIEVFESIGKSEGARVLSYVHPTPQGGVDWKINGYSLKDFIKDEDKIEYYETLDIFITFYKNEYNYPITKADYTKTINQVKKFIHAAIKRHINYIDSSHTELIQLIDIIGKQSEKFERINLFFLTNGYSNNFKEKFDIANNQVILHPWDLNRLFKINETNSIHEPIEIDFLTIDSNVQGLQCLKVPSIDEMYDCYLAIIPGSTLSILYKEYSNELLESNVRAFLGQAGKFNKGIRDTIRNKPQMFLPYNNGITATAESVETEYKNDQLVITKLHDFQIVNGGQTTASLYHTQKKFKDVDLSKIFVQMKLTVIKNKEQKNIEVPNISRFANSQNKVSELDLSSNNPYFVQIENLSRKKYVINPENKNQSRLWFFERANGQYREILNKQNKSQQIKFKEQNPSGLKFIKSDIAKYINIWELEPHYVSQGSQKNFIHYTKKITELVAKNKLPGDNFYRKLISNAILFKTMDRLFGRKGVDAIGDTNLKSFTVAYSLSYFHHLTSNRIDLWRIYEEQKIDDKLSSELKHILIFVYKHIIIESNLTLVSEYAKRSSSWEKLKSAPYEFDLVAVLNEFLISEEDKKSREIEKENNNSETENSIYLISEIEKLGLNFWDGFKIFIENNNSLGFEWIKAQEIESRIRKGVNLRKADLNFGSRVLKYLDSTLGIIDEIKLLSTIQETETIETKFIYDKLSIISKDDWQRMIDLATQTNLFSSAEELSNLKHVYTSFIKKDNLNIKEQALKKAYESLKKMKKFGIHI
jgi:hypothetical protein